MKVAEVAKLCAAVNRAYCHLLGDDSVPEWQEASDEYRESEISGVLEVLAGLRKGIHVAAWDVHNAWVVYKLDHGWLHGETKDVELKTHPCLVPFDKLPKEHQIKDFLFVAVVEACFRGGIEE